MSILTRVSLFVGVLCFFCILNVDAYAVSGKVDVDPGQWKYLDKFCFQSEGTLTIKIWPNKDYPEQKLHLYHDVVGIDDVYGTGDSCDWKTHKAPYSIPLAPDLTANVSWDDPIEHHITIVGMRPRWWWIAISNCKSVLYHNGEELRYAEKIHIPKYEFEFHNEDGLLTKHFSYDEQGILLADIFAFLLLFVILGLCAFSLYKKSTEGDYADPTVQLLKMLVGIVMIHIFTKFLQLVEKGNYARDGVFHAGFYQATTFFDLIPQLLLLGLFVAVAKGWQISSAEVRDKRVIAEVMFTYFILYIFLYAWTFNIPDPRVSYIYQTPPGVMMVFARIAGLIWYLLSLVVTFSKESSESKKMFFSYFGLFGATWFLSLPLIALGASILEDWNRRKVVEIITTYFTIGSYFVFWLIFRTHEEYSSFADLRNTIGSDQYDEEVPDDAGEIQMTQQYDGAIPTTDAYDD